MQEWRNIIGFAGYSVSDDGQVCNDKTEKILTQSINTRGIPIVGLCRDGIQYKRSVAVIVGNAFVTKARSIKWDTPINLDGDRFNNKSANIEWRPRWFAVDYFRQFRIGPQGYDQPIEEIETGMVFNSTWHVATTFGMIERDLVASIVKRTFVFPTFRTYRVIPKN